MTESIMFLFLLSVEKKMMIFNANVFYIIIRVCAHKIKLTNKCLLNNRFRDDVLRIERKIYYPTLVFVITHVQ